MQKKVKPTTFRGRSLLLREQPYVLSNLGDPINREGGHCEIS